MSVFRWGADASWKKASVIAFSWFTEPWKRCQKGVRSRDFWSCMNREAGITVLSHTTVDQGKSIRVTKLNLQDDFSTTRDARPQGRHRIRIWRASSTALQVYRQKATDMPVSLLISRAENQGTYYMHWLSKTFPETLNHRMLHFNNSEKQKWGESTSSSFSVSSFSKAF